MTPQRNTIVVLGAWSCGSTAVAGYIERLGAHSAPPHQGTSDPRTPDSHEPKALRDALVHRIDELTLRWRDFYGASFDAWLAHWLEREWHRADEQGRRHIVLKHPLLALFIADIERVCRPAFVVVTRELDRIEASRRRRQWHPVYGRRGATAIYEHIFAALLAQPVEAWTCHFERLRTDAPTRDRLRTWLGLDPSEAQLARAEDWLR